MRFKKLELLGFKSFAEPTELTFEPGVTAIVGPNGCGKCLPSWVRVTLSDGRIKTIGSLVEAALAHSSKTHPIDDGVYTFENPQGISVPSLNPETLELETRFVFAFVKRTSPSTLIRVCTKGGWGVTATAYHPFFILRNDHLQPIAAEDLCPGIRIAVASLSEQEGSTAPISVTLGERNRRRAVLKEQSVAESATAFQQKLSVGWDEIVTVEEVPSTEPWVYDLSIAQTHNFVAENIVVHNSNIADAIKWVLGEQSARELRGGRMEDLIFSGTDHRDPIHFAEVTLTLDNSDKSLPIDYSEVAISRRLFRTGESEYLLNATAVRLKDITELLMGTGIGTSAYSLFEQGRIEQIINARPEERRAVFEEAAGITKYKAQKREAMRKLEETEANLLRVSDVIAEVKRQIQALERQVKEAKAYQERFEKLKALEVSVARFEKGRLLRKWQEEESSLTRLRQEAAQVEEGLSRHEASLSSAREAVAQMEATLTESREAWIKVTHQRQMLRHRLEVTQERVSEAQARVQQIDKELTSLQGQIDRMTQQEEELKRLLEESDNQRKSKQGRIDQSVKQLQACEEKIAQAQEAIAESQERLLDESNVEVRLKNELTRLRQELTRLEARQSRLALEQTKVSSEKEQAAWKLNQLEEALAQAQGALEGISRERFDARERLSSVESSLAELQKEIQRFEQEMAGVSSQMELLKSLVVGHEGYTSGVKALLTAFEEGRLSREGVTGVLAELIQVSKEDAALVDAALGPYALGLVVDTNAVSQRCRAFLESSQAGRVLFLILDRVPATSPSTSSAKEEPEGAATMAAAAGMAAAVPLIHRIGVTPHLEPLLRLLLADTWVVEDPEAVRSLQNLNPPWPFAFSTRWVTPEGEIFTASSMLLGSAPAEEGLVVGRKSRLQALEAAEISLENRISEAREQSAVLEGERHSWMKTLKDLDSSYEEHSQEVSRLQAHTHSAKEAVANLNQEQEFLKTEKLQVDEELADLTGELREWEGEHAGQEEKVQRLNQTIDECRRQIEEATEIREETSVALATAKTELSSFDEVLSSRRSSLELIQRSLTSSLNQKEAFEAERSRLQQAQKEWQASLVELEKSGEELAREEAEALAKVKEQEEERKKWQELSQEKEREFFTLSRRLDEFKAKLHAEEMEQAQLTFEMDQIDSRLAQVYQVSLESPPETEEAAREGAISSEEELDEARHHIAELSEKLKRMGPVNLGSIEEERELQGRYEFLTAQQNDLLKAKDDLHEAITQINRTTRSMFRETFQAIQKEFQVTFRQLFGGGEARLVLLDEEDLLESGIEIIARPPGKHLQAISLLSGGEKALTTIALLFAIFRVKPSPFCVLDEIDAPLDEPNIGRFTEALKEFLKESQFILITHNKRTITMADVMYGITMEESGVSKIVSVKFKSADNGNDEGSGGSSQRQEVAAHPKPTT